MAVRRKKRGGYTMPSKEQVRKNAQKGDGGSNWMNLPDDVRDWKPKEAGSYLMNFLPYLVTDTKHPDGVKAGSLWYKRPFVVHHGIGPTSKSVVCPRSIGKKCPVHEQLDKMGKGNVDNETYRSLNGQKYVAFNIVDPETKGRIAVFCMTSGKFWRADAGLKVELEEKGSDENLLFWFTEDGKKLKVRFTEDSFGGHKYLKCTKIEFRDRTDMDTDKVLDKTVDLDKMLNVMSYKALSNLMNATEDEDDEEEEDDEGPEQPKRRTKKTVKKRKVRRKPVEEEEAPRRKKKRVVKKRTVKKKKPADTWPPDDDDIPF